MPYSDAFVEPEILITHRGIPVYHTYKDDQIENGQCTYHYTLDAERGEGSESVFDVRTLSTWRAPNHPPFLGGPMTDEERATRKAAWDRWHAECAEEQAIIAAIEAALDSGELAPYRCPSCDVLVPRPNLLDNDVCPECKKAPCVPETPAPPPLAQPQQRYLVKLKYALEAASKTDAVDRLTAAIRQALPTAELQRTDVREAGDAADW